MQPPESFDQWLCYQAHNPFLMSSSNTLVPVSLCSCSQHRDKLQCKYIHFILQSCCPFKLTHTTDPTRPRRCFCNNNPNCSWHSIYSLIFMIDTIALSESRFLYLTPSIVTNNDLLPYSDRPVVPEPIRNNHLISCSVQGYNQH